MTRRSFESQLRRALRVRNWPVHRKIALGAWIPVAIVALAVFTGPNRAGSSTAPPATAPAAQETTTTPIPTTSTTYPHRDVGFWILGKGHRRRNTSAGSVTVVGDKAALQLDGHYLHLAVKRNEQLQERIARHSSTPQTLAMPTSSTTRP